MLQHKHRWMLLLAASCGFYMYFKPEYILILALIIVIDYLVGIELEKTDNKLKKKRILVFSLFANLGVLYIFKYHNFVAQNLNEVFESFKTTGKIPYIKMILPIGLSFHTLQAMSYTIEVSKGKFKAEKHFGIYALYVMFYPQLVAGPIERPQNLIPQFYEVKNFNYESARRGMILIGWGLFKKVVIADRLAGFVNQVHFMPDGYYTGIPLIISYLATPMQVYCDFSGYTDIARGCAQVMGFNLMENFKTPFLQPNVNQYWAAWHLSLTSWFRDYVYLPIRRNLFPNAGMFFSIVLVLVLSGIWHGADWHYIVWGLANAALMIGYSLIRKNKTLSKINNKIPNWLANKIMIVTVSGACVFFRANSVTKACHMLVDMFKNIPQQLGAIIKNTHGERLNYLYVKQSAQEFFLAIIFVGFLLFFENKFYNNAIDKWLTQQSKTYRWIFYYALIGIFIFFGVFKKLDFIYFQF